MSDIFGEQDEFQAKPEAPRDVGATGAGGEQQTATHQYEGEGGPNDQFYTSDLDWMIGRDPGYVKGQAEETEATGKQYAGALSNIGQGSVTQGEQWAGAIAGAGREGADNLVTGGKQAQGDIATGGKQAQAGIQGATNQGTAGITQAATQGAGDLTGFADQQAAAAAAAAARQGQAADFTAQTNALGVAGGLGQQLAGLEALEGPSAAQAQLQSGLNAAQQSNLALARSGRGWGGSASALSQAAVQNAMAGQQAANQSAMLRAQENAAWRQRQASNLAQSGEMQLALSGQLGAQAQFEAERFLKQQAANDALTAEFGRQQLGGIQGAADTRLAGATAAGDLGVRGTTAGFQTGLDALRDSYGIGLDAMSKGYGMNLAGTMGGADTILRGYDQGGRQFGAAGAMDLGAQGQSFGYWGAQNATDIARNKGVLDQTALLNQLGIANAGFGNQGAGAGLGFIGMLLSMLSDKDSKTNIEPTRVLPGGSGSIPYREYEPGSGIYDPWSYANEDEPAFTDQQWRDFGAGISRVGSELGSGYGGYTQPYGGYQYQRQFTLSDVNSKQQIAALSQQVASMGGTPVAGQGQSVTPASRQLGATATPGQTFTPTAQFSQQMGTPAAAPGQTFTASPQFTQQTGMPSPAPARGVATMAQPAGAALQGQAPRGPQTPWEYAQSLGVTQTIGAGGRSYAARPAAQGQGAAGSAQQAQGIGGSAPGATTPSVAKLTGAIGGTPLGQSPTPTPGNALAGIPMGSTLGGTPNSGGMFGAQLDAYAKTNAPAPSGGLALSDKNAKQNLMKLAQYEDHISALGGRPEDAIGRMPLVFDPESQIFRPYDPEGDPQLGAKRGGPGGPWDVPDPLSGPGRIAALDEAQRRQGGQVMLPSPQAATNAIDKAAPKSYEYKPEFVQAGLAPAGRHAGPMANGPNSLSSTPAGRQTVFEGPDGLKRVDQGRLSLLNTAALHDINERVEDLEKKKKRATTSDPWAIEDEEIDLEGLASAYERSMQPPPFGYPGQF